MATGVKPRDDDTQFSKVDLETIQDAMKNPKFRDLLAEYCEEVRDPANQAIYQKEMTQLEKERGYDVTFINPKGGYVIKTSVAGDRKAFINICSNDNVGKPSCNVQVVDGRKGMNWQVPYSLIPPRDDFDHKREKCVIYDVVFHPDTLRMADQNKQFRQLVNTTAFNALRDTYDINLDFNNIRFPKSMYKGMATPAVIKKEDPDYQPATGNEEEGDELSPEIIEKLYPQHIYNQPKEQNKPPKELRKRNRNDRKEYKLTMQNGYTVPKYVIKQQKNMDLQDFTYHKNSKEYSAIPSQIVVEINLPLLSSTKDCILDVEERKLSLVSENLAKYKLSVSLPYSVNDQSGNAKFDKTRRMLIVTLPVIRKQYPSDHSNSIKVDSGVESEENSMSDEDKETLIEVLASSATPAEPSPEQPQESVAKQVEFMDPSLGYTLPPYTHNALEDTFAFTFHVKNTEPDSVTVQKEGNAIYIKFSSIGSGHVPVHYAAIVVFDDNVHFENASGEAWDNNVILQMDLTGAAPQKFQIGLSLDTLTTELFDVPSIGNSLKKAETECSETPELPPMIEVTNSGTETNIFVTTNDTSSDDNSPSTEEREIVWTHSTSNSSAARSILRRRDMGRSFSESSMGDVASSMDYISSDCIPEECSLKKTVRFSDVIAKQVYRQNSSIEGQNKKNQRKKNKKRNQERRKSESEAEDDNNSDMTKISKSKLALKERRDSGLADTSDAETDSKGSPDLIEQNYEHTGTTGSNKSVLNIVGDNASEKSEPTIWETTRRSEPKSTANEELKQSCDNIQHKTDLYNPDNLNKGKYLEVKFKNDLIFDLDM